jgi:peptidyl-tRNA hydrolase, PTH1 family
MHLYVGLGNPGPEYEHTRHNAGFMAVDALARQWGASPWKARFQGMLAEATRSADKCLLFKPMTYMNRSGDPAGAAARFYRIPPEQITVLHDELDVPPGVIRCKTGGGNAGHNGLKSLDAVLGRDYHRVRIGIGHPGDRALVSGYVLSTMPAEERQAVATAVCELFP